MVSSVVAYVPLNESWGIRKAMLSQEQQDFAKSLYYLTKSMDGSRLVSTNDGWENMSDSDMLAIHDYSSLGCELKGRYNESTYNAYTNNKYIRTVKRHTIKAPFL